MVVTLIGWRTDAQGTSHYNSLDWTTFCRINESPLDAHDRAGNPIIARSHKTQSRKTLLQKCYKICLFAYSLLPLIEWISIVDALLKIIIYNQSNILIERTLCPEFSTSYFCDFEQFLNCYWIFISSTEKQSKWLGSLSTLIFCDCLSMFTL